jgi:hypothetical protein
MGIPKATIPRPMEAVSVLNHKISKPTYRAMAIKRRGTQG